MPASWLLRSQIGAMFGLDARLAMVIFAALSVVVGFIGFSRIDTAREARLIRELNAMDEAIHAYQADMGTFFSFTLKNADGFTDLEALWDKEKVKIGFQPRWNGPYVHEETRNHKIYGTWGLFYAPPNREELCTSRSDCHVWIRLTNIPADVWASINQVVDEAYGDQPEEGGREIDLGRVQADTDLDPRQLFYRSAGRAS
jgi:hypothetical protein